MLNPQDFIEARLYDNEEDLIQDALRHLLRGRPELRIQKVSIPLLLKVGYN